MKKFSFVDPTIEGNTEKNWENLNTNIACQEYNPFLYDTPAAGGIDGVTSYHAVYGTFGPIVYFSISLFGTAIEWGVGATLSLPIGIATRAATRAQQTGLSFYALTDTGLIDNGFGTPHSWGTNLGNSTTVFSAYATLGGSTYDSFNLSGWYFR